MVWKYLQDVPDNISNELDQFLPVIQKILFDRGITNKLQLEQFFSTSINALHDYKDLHDIDRAVDLICRYIKEQKKIYIYGDYDVDGICATSILFDFLYRKLGAKVVPYIPSRFDEGYGLGRIGLDRIIEDDGELVVTVDCGIRDDELVREYQGKGLEFIITDHHEPPEVEGEINFPKKAHAVVHPMLSPDYPFNQICGAVVAWKLVQALAYNCLAEAQIEDFNTGSYLELAAMATVCDVMPLLDENRTLVRMGLEAAVTTENLGFHELLKIGAIEPIQLDAYHFGFVLGPRLNAAGRIDHGLEGVRLLTSHDQKQVTQTALRLDELNKKRQVMTAKLIEEAQKQVESQLEDNLLIVYGEGWEDGIVGLVAGRICENYHKPVLAITIDGEKLKGSARSISGYHITEALTKVDELLDRYGGHAQAAGFSLQKSNFEVFIDSMKKHAMDTIELDKLERELEIISDLEIDDITMELYEQIEALKPFGYGNPTPVFVMNSVQVLNKKLLGKDKSHVKLLVTQNGRQIDCIAFSAAERYTWVQAGMEIDIAGTISLNSYMGRDSLQLQIKDMKKSS